MDDWPSGSNLVLKNKVDGEVLYYVGYKYNCKRVLGFLCSENAGSFKDGKPYEARFPDTHGNLQT